jgi:hypothetical protein
MRKKSRAQWLRRARLVGEYIVTIELGILVSYLIVQVRW